MIRTQQDLTTDAVTRRYVPGAVVLLLTGTLVQLTSWPWFEGSGEAQVAHVMARLAPGDPTTNTVIRYMLIMKHTGKEQSLDHHVFTTVTHAGCGGRFLPDQVVAVDVCDRCGKERR